VVWGYAMVIESGRRLQALDFGWWKTPASERPEARLKTIFDGVVAGCRHGSRVGLRREEVRDVVHLVTDAGQLDASGHGTDDHVEPGLFTRLPYGRLLQRLAAATQSRVNLS